MPRSDIDNSDDEQEETPDITDIKRREIVRFLDMNYTLRIVL